MFLFGLPLVFGLAAHSLFVLVDTLLVGQLGEQFVIGPSNARRAFLTNLTICPGDIGRPSPSRTKA